MHTHKFTCSAASAAGPLLFGSPDGPTTAPSGPAPARASRSARRASVAGSTTNGTSGLSCEGSSPSAVLQRSLESRLQARMDVNGSPEYVLTWKHWGMQSGPPICALRASARRTSGKGSSGWPTPQRHDAQGGKTPEQVAAMRARGHGVSNLNEVCYVAGWATPTVGDAIKATPRSKQGLPKQIHGRTPPQSPAGTERRGVLNPALARWLMGFPAAWDDCGATAMPSSRKSRRSS